MAVPDYLYIEEPTADTWILDVTEQPLLLRNNNTGMGAVLAGELSTRPPGSLILALEQAKTMPQVLQVRVKEAPQSLMIKQWSETLEAFSIRLDVIEDSFARSRRLARPAPPSTEMNLLTGKFTPRGHARSELSRFHPALRLAAGLILVLITHWFVEGAGIRSEFQDLQTAIEQTYRSVFPDARNLVDPRYQMEQQLIKARVSNETTAEGNTDFLSMLEKLADVLGAEGHEIQALEFDGASMVMDVSVKDYESLERLQQELAATMRVTVENADLVNGRVNTRLSVEVGI
jgi:type II secretion system protein L